MKSIKNYDVKVLTLVWVLLIILTILEYALAEIPSSNIIVIPGIIIASFFKFRGVAFDFLELKNAHRIWKYLTVSIVSFFLVLILGIYLS